MKYAIFTCLLLLVSGSTAWSQQPTGRRGLDQIDLLSVPTTRVTTQRPVDVDLKTFQLLEPLVRYCGELERDYEDVVMDKAGPLTAEKMITVFTRKVDAITRSLFLIREMESISPQLRALLHETDRFGTDLGLILFTLENGQKMGLGKEVSALHTKYQVPEQSDRKQLVAVILRRLNENLARLRVAS